VREATLATYNIHRAVGTDRIASSDRIIGVLREMQADIVALQEVPALGDNGLAFLDYLVKETGYRAIAGPTLMHESGPYGNALLTRARVVSVARYDLTYGGWEPRGALVVPAGPPPVGTVAHKPDRPHDPYG
jgi:endonuclease/exonuclease/phosphatase family metal-dependent hydrolase